MARHLPSLNQLRAFEAAARLGSIKDGAKELCVTPTAVSHQIKALEEALRHKDKIAGVGLDSAELDNPPSKFERLFAKARADGLYTFAHAGEEGPPTYIWEALDMLRVKRIDHGVRCVEDEVLMKRLINERMPLTVCPLSNVMLNVFDKLDDHNLKVLLDKGLCVTINSDDPAYFGGYLTQNYVETSRCLGLTRSDIIQLARNAIEATLLCSKDKEALLVELNSFIASYDAKLL